ncbi:hypothetical protein [Streptomyces sp. Ac-502]|uniref:hypothetical protein n=1 Tax=Streptomyces sp. Ac-502 TaxID=3342801 RepID=UPI0038627EF8
MTALTALVMVLLPPLLVRAGAIGDGWCVLALLSHIVAATVCLVATAPRQPEMRGGLLTARTLFGRRTVDLDRLTRVGHLMIPGQPASSSVDWLLLTVPPSPGSGSACSSSASRWRGGSEGARGAGAPAQASSRAARPSRTRSSP